MILPYLMGTLSGFIIGIVVASFIYGRPPPDGVKELLKKKRKEDRENVCTLR